MGVRGRQRRRTRRAGAALRYHGERPHTGVPPVTPPLSLTDLFASIDARDATRFAEFLGPDATFRFGNAPPVTGRAAIAQAVAGFFGTIRALEHRLHEHWQGPDSLVCQGEVTYTRHDGTRLTLPFVDVFRLRAGLIQDYLIYMDITPLYAPAA